MCRTLGECCLRGFDEFEVPSTLDWLYRDVFAGGTKLEVGLKEKGHTWTLQHVGDHPPFAKTPQLSIFPTHDIDYLTPRRFITPQGVQQLVADVVGLERDLDALDDSLSARIRSLQTALGLEESEGVDDDEMDVTL